MPTNIDIGCQGGTIASDPALTMLSGSSPVVSVVIGDAGMTFPPGTVSLNTAPLSSGNLLNGGIFGAGGRISISIPSILINFTGSIDNGAQWICSTLANGTHKYTLLAAASDGQIAIVLVTANIGLSLWNGSAMIAGMNVNSTLEFLQANSPAPPSDPSGRAMILKVSIVPRVKIGSVTINSDVAGDLSMIAQTPSKLFVNPSNTQVLTLNGVVDQVTGAPWSASGSISGTLIDDLGNPVQEFSDINIPYVPGSVGAFQVSLGDFNLNPTPGTGYTLLLDGIQGGVTLELSIPVEVLGRIN